MKTKKNAVEGQNGKQKRIGPVTRQASANRIKRVHDAVYSNEPWLLRSMLKARRRVTSYMVSAMLHAIKKGYTECVQVFLEAGLSYQVVDHKNTPAIELAVKNGHTEVAKVLIRNEFEHNGEKALEDTMYSAIRYDNADLFKQIVQWGIREDTVWLIEAVKNTRLSMCQLYLKSFPKCDVNKKSSKDESALWYAILNGEKEMVNFLLFHGADPNLLVEGGLAPILAIFKHRLGLRWCGTGWKPGPPYRPPAQGQKPVECCRRLYHRRGVSFAWVRAPRRRVSTEIISSCLKYGADIASVDEKGNDALILACQAGEEDIVKLLLEHGADADSPRGELLRTPLHWACENGFHRIAKALLTQGCSPDYKDAQLNTPLSASVRMLPWRYTLYSQIQMVSTVRLLLKAGAHPDYTAPSLSAQTSNSNFSDLVNYAFSKLKLDLIGYLIVANSDMSRLSEKTSRLISNQLVDQEKSMVVDLLRALFTAGFTTMAWRIVSHCPAGNRQVFYQQLMTELASEPRSLEQFCRLAVRKTLGIGIEKKIECLCLPEQTKSFIRMDDVLDLLLNGEPE